MAADTTPDEHRWGAGGPGSEGAEALEAGLAHEYGSIRTGAGEGLSAESAEENGGSNIIVELNHPTSADDQDGGAGEMPGLDDAIAQGIADPASRPPADTTEQDGRTDLWVDPGASEAPRHGSDPALDGPVREA